LVAQVGDDELHVHWRRMLASAQFPDAIEVLEDFILPVWVHGM
jgi:hypothetical protein